MLCCLQKLKVTVQDVMKWPTFWAEKHQIWSDGSHTRHKVSLGQQAWNGSNTDLSPQRHCPGPRWPRGSGSWGPGERYPKGRPAPSGTEWKNCPGLSRFSTWNKPSSLLCKAARTPDVGEREEEVKMWRWNAKGEGCDMISWRSTCACQSGTFIMLHI